MVIRSKFLYLSHSFAFKSIGIWGFKIHLKEIQQEYVWIYTNFLHQNSWPFCILKELLC